MKKLISVLLTLVLVLALAACGSGGGDSGSSSNSKDADPPSDRTVKADVQEYINDILGDKSDIDIFEVTDYTEEKGVYTAECAAIFGGQSGKFTMTYELTDGEWELSGAKVKLDETETKQDPAPTEVSETPAASEEKTDASAPETPAPAETTPAPEPTPEPVATGETEMSDTLYDFTFTLDGKVYQLPFPYADLAAEGWTISSNGYTDENSIAANSYEYINLSKNGTKIAVDVINLSGNAKKVKDCKIGGISLQLYNVIDPSSFSIAKGIALTSTVDDITAAYGSANTINSYDDHQNLTYTKDSYQDAKFTIYTENIRYNEIRLRNYVADESDVTETSNAVPEYLASYVAPTELGSDFLSGNFEVDGDLYRLPCPVSAFLDNGWVVTSKPDSVGAGNTESIRIERNGIKFYISILNFADYQTIPENCAVYRLSIYNTDKVPARIPGNLSFSSTKADVEAFVTEDFSYYKGTSSYSYTYDNYKIDYSVGVNVDTTTETVSKLQISNKRWDY